MIRTIIAESLQELDLDLFPQVAALIVEQKGNTSRLLVETARYMLDARLDDLLEAEVFDLACVGEAIVGSAIL
jgi:hypothetical protein